MNPLGARQRVEELARLLDGAVAGPGARTAGHADLAMRLRTLAPALDSAATLRPDFRTALRTRLVAVATVQAADRAVVAPPRPLSWTQTRTAQRRMGAAAGAMASVIVFTGVGVASSRSLPGGPFYDLKRGTEGVQLSLASGDVGKGTKHLEFASTRLREVVALTHGEGELSFSPVGTSTALASGTALGGSVAKRVRDTLAAMDSETRSGRRLLDRAYTSTGDHEPLKRLSAFSAAQSRTLLALIPELPLSARDSGLDSLELVTGIGEDARGRLGLGSCGPTCDPTRTGSVQPSAPAPGGANGASPCNCGGLLPGQPTTVPGGGLPTKPAAVPGAPKGPSTGQGSLDNPDTTPRGVPTVPAVPTTAPTALPTAVPTIPVKLPSLPPLPPLPPLP